ncbi:formaldehyde activating enzyme [Methylophaga lonarensis MPL]|uniref:Formaldehyde activating enzyme n=1 Tax=Methylophaga lonarensis MPL TaxID=1286106 RepID=M7PGI2_9GAMM|nr:formaldehyde-activating enzyme [Methylophaga lonarensis]EMR13005.1 formaldehyde activating enzyme [Methylophaga lonarensis MPL]
MSEPVWFRTAEATVFASDDQGTDAMPEILIGSVKGPAGQAFANLMGQTEGHTRMFAIRATNQQVKPATLMVPKVTIKSSAYVELLGGPVQSAVADAVLDSVIEGVIPKEHADELCIIAMLWIAPSAAADPDVDRKDLYRTNYEAMKLAIKRAMTGSPTIDELIENRQKIHHEMYDPETGESIW